MDNQLNSTVLPRQVLQLSSNEIMYEVDLNKRIINAPRFLSVETDHVSETIYFMTDRIFGEKDLATTTCVIQYITPLGDGKVYAVPYYDTITLTENKYVKVYINAANYEKGKYYILDQNSQYILAKGNFNSNVQYYYHIEKENPKLIIPWVVSGDVTSAPGLVKFSIRFYEVSKDNDEEIIYNLNTQSASSQILKGIEDLGELREEQNDFDPTELEKIYDRLNRILLEGAEIEWIDLL